MSRIDNIKTRISGIFLRDRGNLDEKTTEFMQSEWRVCVEQFFILRDFSVRFFPEENGEIRIELQAKGRRRPQ